MEELFGKFREDDAEQDEAPVRKKKKFKKNAGLEKPEPEEIEEEDPAVEDLVERMAGASASAARGKNRFKKRGKTFPPKADEDEEE